jgi:hypothetical protein
MELFVVMIWHDIVVSAHLVAREMAYSFHVLLLMEVGSWLLLVLGERSIAFMYGHCKYGIF